MKKIIVLENLKPLISRENSFFSRADISLLFAATNDEMLSLHIEHQANLIITSFGLPGLSCERLFILIRQSQGLRAVSSMIVCEDSPGLRERSSRCRADVVIHLPVDPAFFTGRVQKLLDAAPRRSYRVILNVLVEGRHTNRSFLCNLENISAAGILLKSDEVFAPGDNLFCSFYLPDGTHITAHGEIVRAVHEEQSKARKYGVRFVDLPPDAQVAIEAFIHKERQQRGPGPDTGVPTYASGM